jgi:DNA-binding transcriptional MocR family regulator
VNAEAMLERALKRQVIYVAGGPFFVDGTGKHHLRLSFSAPSPERIVEGVTRLAAAVREELATTPASAG